MEELKMLAEPDDSGNFKILASELYYVEGNAIKLKQNLLINNTQYANWNNSNPTLPGKAYLCNGIDLFKHANSVLKIKMLSDNFYEIVSLA